MKNNKKNQSDNLQDQSNKNETEKHAVRSIRTREFMELFKKLEADVRKQAQAAFEKWKDNPAQIDFKPLNKTNNTFWSAKIGYSYRAFAKKTKDDEGRNCYVWTWIGTHEDYDNQLARLQAAKKSSDVINRMRGDTSSSKNSKKLK